MNENNEQKDSLFTMKLPMSWNLVWIFALLEGITFPMVNFLNMITQPPARVVVKAHGVVIVKPFIVIFSQVLAQAMMDGFIVGFLGTVAICLLMNIIVLKFLAIRLKQQRIRKILHPLVFGLWGGIILALIFAIQVCVSVIWLYGKLPRDIYSPIAGFLSAGGSVLLVAMLYQAIMPRLPILGFKIASSQEKFSLIKISTLNIAIIVGLYEGIAIPVMDIAWLFHTSHIILLTCITGLAGGAIGSLAMVLFARLRFVKDNLLMTFDCHPCNTNDIRVGNDRNVLQTWNGKA